MPIASKSELHTLLIEWNRTGTDYPSSKCIHELFEAEAELRPEAIALVFENESVSYQLLNQRANRLARYLSKLGVGPETLVGFCFERSIEMIVGLLGILKAGGAYLPLNPSHPQEHLSQILNDSHISIALTQERLRGALPKHSAQIICLDSQWNEIEKFGESNLCNRTAAGNLAYVMYTSGSTGKPKGVGVIHRAVVRLVKQTNYVNLSPEEVILQLSPVSFDASTFEIWGCLLGGGRLVIMPPHIPSMEEIGKQIKQHGVTTLWLTSALFQQMVETCPQGLSPIRQLLAGGDVLPVTQARKILDELKGIRLINGYGPTENTTFTCCYEMTDSAQVGDHIPIGRPISNTEVYILDEQLQPVMIGDVGELYIGGDGLARGYLNSPGLTAEKFIPNPFGEEAGARLYKTGDLACYRPDGNIEFVGRTDNQVKIRGFRIELEEIEAALNRHPAVRESAVTVRSGSAAEKSLVAYIVPKLDQEEIQGRDLVEQLDRERVDQWRNIYDEVIYHEIDDRGFAQRDPKFNITGWDSSYTGLPLSEEEMGEQVDQTVERILEMRPENVLEIGCGTGLLLFRIAPHCRKYWATDFSEVALRHVRQELSKPGEHLPQVSLFKQTADNFEEIDSDSFDAVVLNSVTQHLPSIQYVARVLEEAVRATKRGGFIFVGDVRSLPLLRAFYTSVELFNSPSSTTLDAFERQVQRNIIQEEELIIAPAFFNAIQSHLPKIGHIQILLKRGRHHNELTRFRYDVIMHIGKDRSSRVEPEWLDWQEQALSPDRVREVLLESNPDVFAIKAVPNARLAAEAKAIELLESPSRPETVGQLREIIRRETMRGVDPEEFWALSRNTPYRVELTWSDQAATGSYDVLIKKQAASYEASSVNESRAINRRPLQGKPAASFEQYANNSLRRLLYPRLVPKLRSHLKENLPDYMMPSAFVILDEIPLTANGKLDRQALPPAERQRPDMEQPYVRPSTPLEELIAGVFQTVLGIDRVGVSDDFFELGGDSLKAVQAVAKLRKALGIEISTISLFDKATVRGLAEAMKENKEQGRKEVISSGRKFGEKRRAMRLQRIRPVKS